MVINPISYQTLNIEFITRYESQIKFRLRFPLEMNAESHKYLRSFYGREIDIIATSGINFQDEIGLVEKSITQYLENKSPQFYTSMPTRIEDQDSKKLLEQIVKVGSSLSRRLFRRMNIQWGVHHSNTEKVKQALNEFLQEPRILSFRNLVDLDGEERLTYPWTLLCRPDAYDYINGNTSLTVNELWQKISWAFQHIIEEQVAPISNGIFLGDSSALNLVIVKDPDIDPKGNHPCCNSQIKPLYLQSRDAFLDYIHQPIDDDILYIFARGKSSDLDSPTEHGIIIRGDEICVDEILNGNGINYQNGPKLLFLNICEASKNGHYMRHSILGTFCFCTEMGIYENTPQAIASPFKIPIGFGRQFASHVLNNFVVQKEPIGRSMLLARQHLLNQWNSPIGFIYMLFGRAELQAS